MARKSGICPAPDENMLCRDAAFPVAAGTFDDCMRRDGDKMCIRDSHHSVLFLMPSLVLSMASCAFFKSSNFSSSSVLSASTVYMLSLIHIYIGRNHRTGGGCFSCIEALEQTGPDF